MKLIQIEVINISLYQILNFFTMINVNKIENRITFKIKTEYYLEVLTPETMKLLGSTKSKVTKTENGENVSRLKD